MEAKNIIHTEELRAKVVSGVNTLANAVKVTLGPLGRNVMIEKPGIDPLVTKDGVTVARNIQIKDKVENVISEIVKEAASKTVDTCGDGTTTATVLAQALYLQGHKNVVAGFNAVEITKGIDIAVKKVLEYLESIAKKIESRDDLYYVAKISSNGDEDIAKLITEAFEKVGENGVMTVDPSRSTETYIEYVNGYRFERGYISHSLVTNKEKMIAELENPYILLYRNSISSVYDIVPILEKVARAGRPLFIIADDLTGDALTVIALNMAKGVIKVSAVKPPEFGEAKEMAMEDIAALCGATYITSDKGLSLKEVELHHLGEAEKVIVKEAETIIVGGKGDKHKVMERIKMLKALLEKETSKYQRDKIKDRIARLDGGIAIIRIAAYNEIEFQEKKDRVEDSMYAVIAAAQEGIVPGGGVAYVRAAKILDNKSDWYNKLNREQQVGVDIVKEALLAPIKQIAQNAGKDPCYILDKIWNEDTWYGWDAKQNKFGDLHKLGVIDPLKVAKNALINAAEVAKTLLTIGAVIVDA